VLLLCTDGLTRMLDDEVIGAFLRGEPTAERACAEMLRTANDGGGPDNITVVVARF
jgi:protein phosphatase